MQHHANKLTTLRNAVNLLARAATDLGRTKDGLPVLTTTVMGQLEHTDTDLLKAWIARRNAAEDLPEDQLAALTNALRNWFRTYAVNTVVSFRGDLQDAADTIVDSKKAYDLLLADYNEASDADRVAKKQVLDAARTNLVAAIAAYEALLSAADNRTATIDDAAVVAYIDGDVSDISALTVVYDGERTVVSADDVYGFIFDGGMTSAKYGVVGMETIFAALCDQLKADGLYTVIDVDALIANANNAPAPEPEPEEPEEPAPGEGEGEGEGDLTEEDIVVPDAPKDKYAVDNNVIAVTYGADMKTAYKTLLLNFNDYAIKTTYNGISYTIEAYGYVVIKY